VGAGVAVGVGVGVGVVTAALLMLPPSLTFSNITESRG
jgi:hypothetical protein